MGLQLFKANSRGTGCAGTFSFNSKERCGFIELIQQVSWDDKNQTGVFKGGNRTVLKLSLFEIGGMIDTLQSGREFKGYHSSADTVQTIKFAPYYAKNADGSKGALKGFAISVHRKDGDAGSEKSFHIGITFSEAATLKQYWIFALEHIFSGIYSDDKKKAEEYKKKKQEKASAPEEDSDDGF